VNKKKVPKISFLPTSFFLELKNVIKIYLFPREAELKLNRRPQIQNDDTSTKKKFFRKKVLQRKFFQRQNKTQDIRNGTKMLRLGGKKIISYQHYNHSVSSVIHCQCNETAECVALK
jgi:hypothetical protein